MVGLGQGFRYSDLGFIFSCILHHVSCSFFVSFVVREVSCKKWSDSPYSVVTERTTKSWGRKDNEKDNNYFNRFVKFGYAGGGLYTTLANLNSAEPEMSDLGHHECISL